MKRRMWRLGVGIPLVLMLGHLIGCGVTPTSPTGGDPEPICVEVDGIVYCY